MPEYLIAFNDEWTPDMTLETLGERGKAGRAVCAEMEEAGVFIFSHGGLDGSTAICNVVPKDGEALFTDGPYVETKEWLGGLTVVNVADEETAKMWAGKIAEACGWPQEVRRFKPMPSTP